ncbi:oligosaccharide 4-alpha-D-glucosyltransferase [Hymenobacter sp. UYCo722]
MKDFFRAYVSSWARAALLLLLSAPSFAQRAGGGPPATDPFGRRVVPARTVPGGRYLRSAHYGNTLLIRADDNSSLKIQSWAPGIVKIGFFTAARGLNTDADSSVSVVQKVTSSASLPLDDDGQFLRVALGGSLRAVIRKYPLRVSILQRSDTLIAEAMGAFRRQAAAPTPATLPEPGGVGVRFRLAPGERLYGTGSRALPLDRRGYRLELYNQAHYASRNGEPNLNIALPTVLSSRGYMLFFDNHAPGYLDLGKTDPNVLEYGGEGLRSLSYFVITGRDQAEILDRYTALTGRQPLPPRWALGLIQSRFGYKSDTEIQQVAGRMRRENFPLDALVLDLYWFGGTKKQGDFAWEPAGFPDPAGMMGRLKQQGVKTILISEPYVMRTSRNDSLVRTQALVGTDSVGRPFTVGSFWAGPASIVDVFRPAARDWLWGNYRRLHNQGAAGWWSDLGEPENHPAAMRHVTGSARSVHNAYGQVWAGILRDNYAREFPEERVFNLARSGWAGLQRNGVFPWSGDINRSWSGFQAQVPVMLGMGQGGVGYMHSDAGGFCAGDIDPELYTRWLQMASLCPILRPHGEGVPPEPYFYPDPYKSAVRDAVHLRYELLPYLYTLAWQNTTTGAPLVRSMDFDLRVKSEKVIGTASAVSEENTPPANPKFSTFPDDQYLLGPSLLVAPVMNPSQRQRNVTLPAGNWIDFHTNQTHAGGRTVAVPAPLAHTPLLVRAGAMLPMTAYRPSTDQFRADTLLLRYYPEPQNPESQFTLYEDDGHSAQALAKSEFDLLALSGHFSAAQTTVELHAKGGHYPGQPTRRTVQLLVARVAAAPTAVLLDGQPLPATAVTFAPATGELHVAFAFAKPDATLELRGLRLNTAPATNAAPETLTLEAPDQRSFGAQGTTLRYTTHAPGAAELRVHDARGTVVRTLPLAATTGAHHLAWDARDATGQPLPPGVYTAETAGQHQRLILTR